MSSYILFKGGSKTLSGVAPLPNVLIDVGIIECHNEIAIRIVSGQRLANTGLLVGVRLLGTVFG